MYLIDLTKWFVKDCWRKISNPRQAHNKSNEAGLTHVPDPKRASQFFLKLTKDEKYLDKTRNLSGGTRQFRIYGLKAN
jgi:ABC-type iron transport system FetAB ATPase subunit